MTALRCTGAWLLVGSQVEQCTLLAHTVRRQNIGDAVHY